MLKKSLALEERLGHKEGMANDYYNIGILYQLRGELENAEKMYQKSLFLFTEINSPLANNVLKLLNDVNDNSAI